MGDHGSYSCHLKYIFIDNECNRQKATHFPTEKCTGIAVRELFNGTIRLLDHFEVGPVMRFATLQLITSLEGQRRCSAIERGLHGGQCHLVLKHILENYGEAALSAFIGHKSS
jgi:hypothetical protein